MMGSARSLMDPELSAEGMSASRVARGHRARQELVIVLAVLVLGFLNLEFPIIRFSWQTANLVFGTALFTLPLVLPLLVLRLNARRLPRILAAIIIAPFVAVSLLVALLTGSCAQDSRANGFDPSFEPIAVLPVSGSQVTAYRTNGGAMTRFGIVVRHERPILPGLLLVRNVFGAYPASEATLRASGAQGIEVLIGDRATLLKLDRFVYF
jgi:hypothetical protein